MKASGFKLPFVGLVWLTVLIFGWLIVDAYPKMPKWYCMGLFVLMLFVSTICSVMILWVLKRPKPGEGDKEGAYQLKKKAFVAVATIFITLLFGYGTVACVILLRDHLSYHTYCLVVGLSWWCLLPSSAVQPYLYLSKIYHALKMFNIFIIHFSKWSCYNMHILFTYCKYIYGSDECYILCYVGPLMLVVCMLVFFLWYDKQHVFFY